MFQPSGPRPNGPLRPPHNCGLIQLLTSGDLNFAEGESQPRGQTPPAVQTEQKCSYCGHSFSAQMQNCPDCGTTRIPPIIEDSPAASAGTSALNAGKATLILLAFLAGQLCFAALGGVIFATAGGGGAGIRASEKVAEFNKAFLAPAVMLGFIGGGLAMIWLSWGLMKEGLADTSETGAAWAVGDWKGIAKGLGLGASVALAYFVAAALIQPHGNKESVGPLTRMWMTKGLPQVLLIIMALFLAPPLEEMLFRGVLYGGYRKSLGARAAAWLTTSIFALLHVAEAVHFPLAMVAIVGMALLALRMRLRHSAIGPAIAAHFGYNTIISLGAICSTWLSDS